jgi:hypothetical protein
LSSSSNRSTDEATATLSCPAGWIAEQLADETKGADSSRQRADGRRRRYSAVATIVAVCLAAAVSIFVITRSSEAGSASYRSSSFTYTGTGLFTFHASSVAQGSVSATQAAATAAGFAQAIPSSGQVPGNIAENEYFGTYSDRTLNPQPVWLITYTGAGVNIGGDNPVGPVQYDHAELVTVSATTGQFLEEITCNASDFPSLPQTAVYSLHAAAARR